MGYSPSSTASLNGATWSLTAVALVIVAIRIYARTRLAHAFGADDAVIIVSVVLSVAYTSMLSVAAANGTGTPLAEIPRDKVSISIKLNIIAGVFGIMAFATPKLSVGLLLRRVLNPKPLTKFLVIAAPIFAILLSCALVLITFLQCSPPRGLWNPEIHPKCISSNVLPYTGIVAGSYSAFLDIVYAVYPTVVVLKLQMSPMKKVGFCAVFSLGLIAAAATIVKCVQVPGIGNHANVTQSDVQLLIWSSVETNLIIIAASIPTLGPLWKRRMRLSPKAPKRASYREFSGKADNYSYQLRGTGNQSRSRSDSALAQGSEDDGDDDILSNDIERFDHVEDVNITKTVEVFTTTVEPSSHTVLRYPAPTPDDASGGQGQGGDMRTWYHMPNHQPRYMT